MCTLRINQTTGKVKRLSALAQLIVCLRKEGIVSTTALADETGYSERQIWRAKAELSDDGTLTPMSGHPDANVTDTPDTDVSQPLTPMSGDSRARIESSLREDTSLKKVAVVAAACADAPKVPSSKEDLDRLETQLLDACNGALDNPVNCSGLLNLGEPLSWLKAGCDLDLDVLPTLRAIGKREHGKKIGSWRYFQRAVLEAKTAREAGVSEGQNCHSGGRRFSDPQVAERWRQHNEYMRKARIECGLEVAS